MAKVSRINIDKEIPGILQKNGVPEEIEKIITSDTDLGGEHLCSLYEYLTIYLKGRSSPLELFIKRSPENPSVRAMVEAFSGFKNESQFYNIIVPELEKLCLNTFGSKELLGFLPKPYYCDEETLIMENIVKSGYKMLDKFEGHDLQQAKLATITLAQFHGLTHRLIVESGGKEEFLQKYPFLREPMYLRDKKPIYQSFFGMIDGVIKVLELSKIEGAAEGYQKLKKYERNVFDYYCDLAGESEPNLHTKSKHFCYTINHSDYWNNNMMFLASSKESGMHPLKVFDFQVMRVGSPNLDLSYYLYTSVKSQVRRENINEFLRIYFEEFKKVERGFECTFEEFLEDYKHNALLGFFYGVIAIASLRALDQFDLESTEDLWEDFSRKILKWLEDHKSEEGELVKQILGLIDEYEIYSTL